MAKASENSIISWQRCRSRWRNGLRWRWRQPGSARWLAALMAQAKAGAAAALINNNVSSYNNVWVISAGNNGVIANEKLISASMAMA